MTHPSLLFKVKQVRKIHLFTNTSSEIDGIPPFVLKNVFQNLPQFSLVFFKQR